MDLPESFDDILHKTVLVIVLLIPLFLDSISNCKIIKEREHYVAENVEARADEESLQEKKDEIEDGVEFDMSCTLMCWSPKDSFRPDLILTELGKIEQDVRASVMWDVVPPFSSGRALFGRVIAAFDTEENAIRAAEKLVKITKSVITFQLNQIIDLIIEAELRHPQFGKRHTRVFVLSRVRPSGRENKARLRELLYACGNVTEVNFCKKSEAATDTMDPFVVCDATYVYASHAYVAKFLMDGLYFWPTQANLFVKIEESEKEKDLARTVRSRLIQMLDEKKAVRV